MDPENGEFMKAIDEKLGLSELSRWKQAKIIKHLVNMVRGLCPDCSIKCQESNGDANAGYCAKCYDHMQFYTAKINHVAGRS